MTISPTIKAKVIELHLQKKGRNEIARKINISQGSVHNILRAYKDKSTTIAGNGHNQNFTQISATPVEDIHTESLSQESVINAYEQKYEQPLQAQSQICSNTTPDMNKMGSAPVSMVQKASSWVGQAIIPISNSNHSALTSRNGGPLLDLLNHESIDRGSNENADIDFADSEYHIPFLQSPSKTRQISSISYRSGLSDLSTLEEPVFVSEEQVDNQADVKDVLEEESEELKGVLSAQEIESSKPNNPRSNIARIPKSTVEKSIHDKLEQERVAWDYYGPAWMRVLDQIRREKYQRRHEFLVIDRRKQKLSEWKK